MFFISSIPGQTRFDLAQFMDDVTDAPGADPLTSYFLIKLKSLPVRGQYVVQTEENRPDLIASRIYGSTQYWWILLLYNDMFSPTELVAGVVLNYPSPTDLSTLYFRLNSLGHH